MADLICEGQCNPTLPKFDDAAEMLAEIRVRAAARQPVPPSVAEAALDTVIGLRRTLRHTAHVHRGGNRWACEDCGTDRTWGASDALPRWGSEAWVRARRVS